MRIVIDLWRKPKKGRREQALAFGQLGTGVLISFNGFERGRYIFGGSLEIPISTTLVESKAEAKERCNLIVSLQLSP